MTPNQVDVLSADFCWRAEAAFRAACPSPMETVVGDWLLRTAGGPMRRINSANPLHGDVDTAGVMAEVEDHYRALGLAPLFRIPSLIQGFDSVLEEAGYAREGVTLTLARSLNSPTRLPMAVRRVDAADSQWLAARSTLSGGSDADAVSFAKVIGAIRSPAVFVSVPKANRVASLGYGVVYDGLLIIEAVATDSRFRRLGYAEKAVEALLHWGEASGARHACLQVVADNAPALRLYQKLGFGAEIYRYHYRRKQ